MQGFVTRYRHPERNKDDMMTCKAVQHWVRLGNERTYSEAADGLLKPIEIYNFLIRYSVARREFLLFHGKAFMVTEANYRDDCAMRKPN
jgi:hypothetical protein